MGTSGLLLPPPLYLPAGVKSGRPHSVPAGSVLYLDGYPPNGTTIYDKSGNGNNGTITGATWVRLRSGLWGLNHAGEQYVSCGNLGAFPATGTIKIWFKPDPVENYRNLWTTRDQDASINSLRLQMYTASTMIHCFVGAQSIAIATGLTTKWYFLAVTWSVVARTVAYNINNATGTLTYTTETWPTTIPSFTVGRGYDTSAARSYKGQTGSVLYVTPALSTAQVSQIFAREQRLFGA